MAAPFYVSKILVRKAVESGLSGIDTNELTDDTDFFVIGLDSLKLISFTVDVRQLGCAWVNYETIYKNPTINTLTARLHRGPDDEALHPDVATMFRLIEKHSNFARRVSNTALIDAREAKLADKSEVAYPNGHHVLVTGGTGSLGSHIVAQLAANTTVTKIYCLVRQNNAFRNPRDRVIDSLKRRNLLHSGAHATPNVAERAQLDKIVAFNSVLAHDKLGLSTGEYTELRNNLNEVIHCAWTMNYLMILTSFEHLIRGSVNLISLCLESNLLHPASFQFASSIAAAPGSPVLESLNLNFNSLIGASGYAQSKCVVEHLCSIAVDSCIYFEANVHRLGYLVGDRTHGRWSKSEEYPLIARSLEKIKFLPALPREMVSWLPVDDAAKACVELMFTADEDLDNFAVFNVAHPRLVSWDGVFLAGITAARLAFEKLPAKEWVQALKAADPGYPLLRYFEAAYTNDDDVSSPIVTVVAQRCSAHLRGCPAVTVELVKKFVEQWVIVLA